MKEGKDARHAVTIGFRLCLLDPNTIVGKLRGGGGGGGDNRSTFNFNFTQPINTHVIYIARHVQGGTHQDQDRFEL